MAVGGSRSLPIDLFLDLQEETMSAMTPLSFLQLRSELLMHLGAQPVGISTEGWLAAFEHLDSNSGAEFEPGAAAAFLGCAVVLNDLVMVGLSLPLKRRKKRLAHLRLMGIYVVLNLET